MFSSSIKDDDSKPPSDESAPKKRQRATKNLKSTTNTDPIHKSEELEVNSGVEIEPQVKKAVRKPRASKKDKDID